MVKRLTISLDAELADEVAERAEPSISAWIAEAIRARLRRERLRAALVAYEAEEGSFTSGELEALRAEWPD